MLKHTVIAVAALTLSVSWGFGESDDQFFGAINEATMVMTCKISNYKHQAEYSGFCTQHHCMLTMTDVKMFRGNKPDTKPYYFITSTGSKSKFTIPVGVEVIIYFNNVHMQAIKIATPERLDIIKKAMSLPRGWRYKDGKVVSPYAESNIKWPAKAKVSANIVCSKTNRPALTIPDGIKWTVKQVIPKEIQKYTNSYGDGKFTVTVANTTEKKLTVPGLLRSGGKILWEASVLFKGSTTTVHLPHEIPDDVESVELEPGESLSHEVNILLLPDYKHIKGSRRVSCDFILCNKVANSFYYHSYPYHHELAELYRAEMKKDQTQHSEENKSSDEETTE